MKAIRPRTGLGSMATSRRAALLKCDTYCYVIIPPDETLPRDKMNPSIAGIFSGTMAKDDSCLKGVVGVDKTELKPTTMSPAYMAIVCPGAGLFNRRSSEEACSDR